MHFCKLYRYKYAAFILQFCSGNRNRLMSEKRHFQGKENKCKTVFLQTNVSFPSSKLFCFEIREIVDCESSFKPS